MMIFVFFAGMMTGAFFGILAIGLAAAAGREDRAREAQRIDRNG